MKSPETPDFLAFRLSQGEYLLVDSIGVEGLATCCSIFGARSLGSNRVEILDTARDSVPRLQSTRNMNEVI